MHLTKLPGGGVAISINPGMQYGFDLEPDMVSQLIHLSASRKQNPQGGA